MFTVNGSVFYCVEVEEVKRRQHCLVFSSAGSQAQTYFVNFDTLADYQRWHRQASKVSRRQKACAVCVMSFSSCSGLFVFGRSCWGSTETGCWSSCFGCWLLRPSTAGLIIWLALQRRRWTLHLHYISVRLSLISFWCFVYSLWTRTAKRSFLI